MSAPLLEAHALSRTYRVARGLLRAPQRVPALDAVSFNLAAGQTLGVVGESGSGKSTLARLLALLESPTSGHVRFEGIDLAQAPAEVRRRVRPAIQMVFQNPYASLNPRWSVEAILDEGLAINTPLRRAQRRERIVAMLDAVGLGAAHLGRYPHMFSGGQRQRIALARALMTAPKLVIADEPTSALDVSVQAQIVNLMQDLQTRTQLAYVFISHNLGVVEHIADIVLVMYQGRVMEAGPAAQVFATPGHPYTRALLAATPRLDAPAAPPAPRREDESPIPNTGCAYAGRCPHAQPVCRAQTPPLSGDPHRIACHFAGTLG